MKRNQQPGSRGPLSLIEYNNLGWQLDRAVALAASSGGGGKSELHRAVCRI